MEKNPSSFGYPLPSLCVSKPTRKRRQLIRFTLQPYSGSSSESESVASLAPLRRRLYTYAHLIYSANRQVGYTAEAISTTSRTRATILQCSSSSSTRSVDDDATAGIHRRRQGRGATAAAGVAGGGRVRGRRSGRRTAAAPASGARPARRGAAAAAGGERLLCTELLRGGRGRAARVLALVLLGPSVRQERG